MELSPGESSNDEVVSEDVTPIVSQVASRVMSPVVNQGVSQAVIQVVGQVNQGNHCQACQVIKTVSQVLRQLVSHVVS